MGSQYNLQINFLEFKKLCYPPPPTHTHTYTHEMDSITDSMDMNLSKLRETVEDGESLACSSPRGAQRVRHDSN